MAGKLDQKVAVITGAGSGIGRAIAQAFSAEGAALHLLGRRRGKLEGTRQLCAVPKQVQLHEVDLAQPAAIDDFVGRIRNQGASVQILVNNASLLSAGRFSRVSPADYDAAMDVNLKAVFFLCQGLIPLMRPPGGAIINISSTLAYMSVPGCSVYSISKAGLLMLTRCLAIEYAAAGIRCNAISPGVVDTPIFLTVMNPAQAAEHLHRKAAEHPLGRVGTPTDIAAAAVFLASDEAAWITGVNLPVDGGISLT